MAEAVRLCESRRRAPRRLGARALTREDDLDAAGGIARGLLLGVGIWLVIGLVIFGLCPQVLRPSSGCTTVRSVSQLNGSLMAFSAPPPIVDIIDEIHAVTLAHLE